MNKHGDNFVRVEPIWLALYSTYAEQETPDETLDLEVEALDEWCSDVFVPALKNAGVSEFKLKIKNGKVKMKAIKEGE